MKYLISMMLIVLVACGKDSGGSGSGGGGAGATSAVYVYQSDENLPQDTGNLTAINNRCQTAFSTHSPTVSCTRFLGLVGHSSTNGIQNFISVNGMNASFPVKLVDGTTIASSFSGFIANGPPVLNGANWAGWPDSYWYTGLDANGNTANNCSDYTDYGVTPFFNYGTNNTSTTWHVGSTPCNYYSGYRHLCVCY